MLPVGAIAHLDPDRVVPTPIAPPASNHLAGGSSPLISLTRP